MKLIKHIGILALMAALLNIVDTLYLMGMATDISEEVMGEYPGLQREICSNFKHFPLSKFTCCNGSILTNWINEKFWSDCQSVPSTGDENATDSIWRVYTCALSKSLGSDPKTISLVEFTNLMTTHYPEKIKDSIRSSIKDLGSKSSITSEKADWLTSDISLTDYSSINQIRVQYYDVEKQVCSDQKMEFDISSESQQTCNYTEEIYHRFGRCSGNGSWPFRLYPNSPTIRLNSKTTYNKTMERLLTKFDKDVDKSFFLYLCHHPCNLIANSLITMDDFLKFRHESDVPPMEIIVNSTFPYLPLKVIKYLETSLNNSYNGTQHMQYSKTTLTHMNLTNSAEDLYGCAAFYSAYHWLAKFTGDGR